MKKTVLAVLMSAVLFPAITYAERGMHHERMVERMAEELDLSEEQRMQVEAVFKEQKPKFEALREETRSRIEAILNEEQRTKMERLKAERKARWEEKRRQWQKTRSEE